MTVTATVQQMPTPAQETADTIPAWAFEINEADLACWETDNSPETYPAPCPHCGTTVTYAASVVRCPNRVCKWRATLTAQEAHDFLFAVTGIAPLDLAAFLRGINTRVLVPAPRTVRTARGNRKQIIPQAIGPESPYNALVRLAAQAALNGAAVVDWNDDYTAFTVTSQEADATGWRESYTVRLTGNGATCTCPRGLYHPGAPCGHIGLVLRWLEATYEAAPSPVLPITPVVARPKISAERAYAEIF